MVDMSAQRKTFVTLRREIDVPNAPAVSQAMHGPLTRCA
jgi:hypothetical protein